jgi:cation diffusion facilitator family transporter
MHRENLSKWQHEHRYHTAHEHGETRTRWVVALTAFMMIAEIAGGLAFGSMALLADGWHMGTHVAALGITLFAYAYARRHASDPRYSFGTGKVGVLGGFASAVVLGVVALLMAVESFDRLLNPVGIRFNEAIGVAVIGLVVNLVSALLLKDHHHHHHGHHHEDHDHHNEAPEADGHAHHHDHDHEHHHHEHHHHPRPAHHHDHNLRAAYLHVLADALTSVLAIVALVAGKYFNWIWADAAMGIVGAIVITRWAWGLMRDTSRILLDSQSSLALAGRVRTCLEEEEDVRVADLHLWPLGENHQGLIVSLVTHHPRPAEHYKARLRGLHGLDHITVEVNECTDALCVGGVGPKPKAKPAAV